MRRLSELCTSLTTSSDRLLPEPLPTGKADCVLTTLTYDSRACTENCAYFAFNGIHTDGSLFIEEAIAKGAKLIVCEKEPQTMAMNVQYLVTNHPRRMFAKFSAAWFDYPAKGLRLIGVTGTDGKSSTCDFLWQLLRACGVHAGLLGTVTMDDGSTHGPSPYRQSTPEAFEIQAFLARCRDNGLATVILETTSHALSTEYDRLAGLEYHCAIYTSITTEHLEFHKSLGAYVDAKLNLARRMTGDALLVFPEDNAYAPQIRSAGTHAKITRTCAVLPSTAKIVSPTAPAERQEQRKTADLCATVVEADMGGCRFTLSGPVWRGAPTTIHSFPMGPAFFLKNALEALLAANFITQKPMEELVPLLHDIKRVSGRFNLVPNTLGFTIVVDFAHTADAFYNLMSEVRKLAPRARMLAVFGAAGERDSSKRAPMGREAVRWCDVLYISDEDPRNEQPMAILEEIASGIPKELARRREIHLIPDRTKAIAEALRAAKEGDVVLFLGKGHEQSIEYAQGRKIPWNETQTIEREITRLTSCKESCFL